MAEDWIVAFNGSDIGRIANSTRQGDGLAAEQLMPLVYCAPGALAAGL
ncbi:MAG: hypothetical protein OEX13_21030 [Gammaproteobacteria bacterium]|nr:hypothetical protein [Gammaproteobacteria bacterium]